MSRDTSGGSGGAGGALGAALGGSSGGGSGGSGFGGGAGARSRLILDMLSHTDAPATIPDSYILSLAVDCLVGIAEGAPLSSGRT